MAVASLLDQVENGVLHARFGAGEAERRRLTIQCVRGSGPQLARIRSGTAQRLSSSLGKTLREARRFVRITNVGYSSLGSLTSDVPAWRDGDSHPTDGGSQQSHFPTLIQKPSQRRNVERTPSPPFHVQSHSSLLCSAFDTTQELEYISPPKWLPFRPPSTRLRDGMAVTACLPLSSPSSSSFLASTRSITFCASARCSS